MAEVVECLLCKHKVLSSNSNPTKKYQKHDNDLHFLTKKECSGFAISGEM
jgi:hypothetical protein